MTPDKFPNIFIALLAQSLALGGSETEVFLSTIKTLDGQTVQTSDFAYLGRAVLSVDVQSASRIEFIGATGVSSGDIAFTGCTRGLSFKDNTVIAANKKFHAVGAPVIIAFGTHNLIDLETIIQANYADIEAQITALIAAIQIEYLALNGSNTPSTDISWATHKIINLGNATNPQDAVTYSQLQAAVIAGGVAATTANGGYVKVATNTEFQNTTNTTVVGPFTFYNMPTISQLKSAISTFVFPAGVSFTGASAQQAVFIGDDSQITRPSPGATGVGGQKFTIDFTPLTAVAVTGAQFLAIANGVPSGLKASIQTDSSGQPSGTILASQTQFPTSSSPLVYTYTWAAVNVPANTKYWIVVEPVNPAESGGYALTDSSINSTAQGATYNGSAWVGAGYISGLTPVIKFSAGSVFPSTSATSNFITRETFGGKAGVTQGIPSIANACDGVVTTTVALGGNISVQTDGFVTLTSALTNGVFYFVGANSLLSSSGSIKVGRAINGGATLFIRRY